jgi:large subunit ribosomal protein L21
MDSKLAIIKTGGKQYRVTIGDKVDIEKIDVAEGEKINFETLLISDEDAKNFEIGKPSLGEKVEGRIIEHGKAKKILVTKYKNKTRYLKNVGHRQQYTKVEITKI